MLKMNNLFILLFCAFLCLNCNYQTKIANKQDTAGKSQDKYYTTKDVKKNHPQDSVNGDFSHAKKDLESKLSNDFTFYENSYFLVISNLSTGETNKIIDNTISRAVDCFYNNYFDTRPDEATTILLFKDDKSYRSWAKE